MGISVSLLLDRNVGVRELAVKKRKDDHLNEDARGRLRFRPLSGDNPSNDINMEAENNQFGKDAEVGHLLKTTRLGLGQSVDDVCQLLRIRKIYIEAIENSDFALLPKGPYGLGFVKAYAEHLGLDGAEITRRFREESHAPAVRSELSFPKPVQESRVPGGAVLLIAALFGLGAYGGWYYLSSQGKTIADLVDPLPQQLASYTTPTSDTREPRTLENAADAQAAEASSEGSGSDALRVPQTDQASATGSDEGADTANTAATTETADASGDQAASEAVDAPAEQAEAAAPAEQAEAPAAEVAEAPATESASPAAALETPEVAQAPSEPAPEATAEATTENAAENTAQNTPAAPAAEVASVPDAPEVGDAGGARVFGAVNVDSRVTISAVETSWVRIREADGTVLLTRMLTAGDTYRVPNRDGLKLEVGNAGALTYSIDGSQALPVGEYGAVMSDFSLNVDDLENSQAQASQ